MPFIITFRPRVGVENATRRWRKREIKRHNETRFKIASKGEETAARKIAVHGESDG